MCIIKVREVYSQPNSVQYLSRVLPVIASSPGPQRNFMYLHTLSSISYMNLQLLSNAMCISGTLAHTSHQLMHVYIFTMFKLGNRGNGVLLIHWQTLSLYQHIATLWGKIMSEEKKTMVESSGHYPQQCSCHILFCILTYMTTIWLEWWPPRCTCRVCVVAQPNNSVLYMITSRVAW